MNICFLGSFTGGGTESSCFKIANGLSKKHSIFILSTSKTNKTFILYNCIKFYNLQSHTILGRNKEIYCFLRKNKIDVLVTLEAMTGIFSIVSAKIYKCKHIVWEHANYFQNQGSRWIKIIRQIELLFTDAYITLTEKDLNNFKKHFLCKSVLQNIYNIADAKKNHSYQVDSKTIISVGHIRKIKNFIIIPDVAKIVFKKHPDWKWKIYGADVGEEYERIKQKVKKYGLEKNVIFFGRCCNMENEYSKAAIYVLTSLQEGLPMVLLEAKSHGLPIVSFDIETGPDEIIRDNVNGFLIPPYDINIMAEKICYLIENKNKRVQFSENSGLDLNKFDSSRILNQWENLLKKLI